MRKARHNAEKREMLAMATVAGKQLTIKAGTEEKEYILQHPGVRGAMELRGRSKDMTGQLDEAKYFEELMKKVIFLADGKKTNWEYWELEENFEHQSEVLEKASTFLMGRSS